MPMDEGYEQYFSSAVNTAKRAKKRRAKKRAAAKKAAKKRSVVKPSTRKENQGYVASFGSAVASAKNVARVTPMVKKSKVSNNYLKEKRVAGPSVGRAQRRAKSSVR